MVGQIFQGPQWPTISSSPFIFRLEGAKIGGSEFKLLKDVGERKKRKRIWEFCIEMGNVCLFERG